MDFRLRQRRTLIVEFSKPDKEKSANSYWTFLSKLIAKFGAAKRISEIGALYNGQLRQLVPYF